MSTPGRCAQIVAALALAACSGPKGTPEGTVEVWLMAQNSQDVDAMINVLTPTSKAKIPEKKLRAHFEEMTVGMQQMKIKKMQPVITGKQAQVQVTYDYVWRVRGKEPEPNDDNYEAFLLELIDGKWYLTLPGTAKIGAY